MADDISTVLVAEDGSIVLAGYTSGDWSGSNAGKEDYLVVKVRRERLFHCSHCRPHSWASLCC